MLYEVELRKHRDTHRLLTSAEKQLTQFKEDGEIRRKAMQAPNLKQNNTPRLSIDSNDAFSQRLCTLLGKISDLAALVEEVKAALMFHGYIRCQVQ